MAEVAVAPPQIAPPEHVPWRERARDFEEATLGAIHFFAAVASALPLLATRERLLRHCNPELESREDRRIILKCGPRLEHGGAKALQPGAEFITSRAVL